MPPVTVALRRPCVKSRVFLSLITQGQLTVQTWGVGAAPWVLALALSLLVAL